MKHNSRTNRIRTSRFSRQASRAPRDVLGFPRTVKVISLPPMREDVAGTLFELVAYAPADPNSRAAWSHYELAKRALSALCGWDANPCDYDQNLYDRAIRTYIREVGL